MDRQDEMNDYGDTRRTGRLSIDRKKLIIIERQDGMGYNGGIGRNGETGRNEYTG